MEDTTKRRAMHAEVIVIHLVQSLALSRCGFAATPQIIMCLLEIPTQRCAGTFGFRPALSTLRPDTALSSFSQGKQNTPEGGRLSTLQYANGIRWVWLVLKYQSLKVVKSVVTHDRITAIGANATVRVPFPPKERGGFSARLHWSILVRDTT